MRSPILAALAAIAAVTGLPLPSLAQSPPPPTREEALTAARRNLAKCEAMAAENPKLQTCVRDCSRAVDEAPTAKLFVVAAIHKSCNDIVKYSEEQVRLAAEKKRRAEQQKVAQAKPPNQPTAATTPAASARAQVTAGELTPAPAGTEALRVDGAIDWGEYENERTLYHVFVGDYQRFTKGSFPVRVFLQFYLDAFEANCGPFLPPDSAVLVRKTIEVTRTAGGFRQENVVDTKRITMAPKFVDGYQNFPSGGGAYAISGGPGDRNMVKNVITFLQAWNKDVNKFFEVEACQGATMLQLGENLARLTAGRPPIQAEPNATKLLAGLRVSVPKSVEDADVRAKRARVDAYWNAERASWGEPPTVQKFAAPGYGNQLRIKYAAVAPDFAIPIPTPEADQYIEINVEKSYGRRIRWIKLVSGTPPYAVADFTDEQWPIFYEAARTLQEEGARVLSCTYDAVGTLKTVNYWYRETPKSLNAIAMKVTWSGNPLQAVRAPRTNCPTMMP
jgi:hypothetical protein